MVIELTWTNNKVEMTSRMQCIIELWKKFFFFFCEFGHQMYILSDKIRVIANTVLIVYIFLHWLCYRWVFQLGGFNPHFRNGNYSIETSTINKKKKKKWNDWCRCQYVSVSELSMYMCGLVDRRCLYISDLRHCLSKKQRRCDISSSVLVRC